MNSRVTEFFDTYLATLPAPARESKVCVGADYFCADRESANICAELVLKGVKVATCSLKHWYQSSGIPLPQVGGLYVITSWAGEPTSIIEITSVIESRFCDVSQDFAYSEGEGDKSLADWRRTHWAFFERECLDIGIVPNEEMKLILERFKVVFPLRKDLQAGKSR